MNNHAKVNTHLVLVCNDDSWFRHLQCQFSVPEGLPALDAAYSAETANIIEHVFYMPTKQNNPYPDLFLPALAKNTRFNEHIMASEEAGSPRQKDLAGRLREHKR